MASISARLDGVKRDPMLLLDPASVERACRRVGHCWRQRTLSPLGTLAALAVQMLHGNTAIAHVVRLMGNRFSESAYCQARARLPVAVARAALEDFLARQPAGAESLPPAASRSCWKARRVVLIDGTGVSMPDTPALREAFDVASGTRAGSGLPCAKVLTVFDAADGSLLDMHIASIRTGDLTHADELHPALQPGDVLVGDRGLCAYTHLAQLKDLGCDGLFRMPATRSMPFPARSGPRRRFAYGYHRHAEPILIEMIARNDQVVEIVKPHNRPRYMTPEAFASLPGKQVVRSVRYTIRQPGYRPHEITLLTTLIDGTKYSAEDLADLYLMRWRVETNLLHLKRTLGMDRLKCASVDGVTREALMLGLIYNAVCRVRAVSAASQQQAPTRLSFIDTLRVMLLEFDAAEVKQRWLPQLLHPPDIKVWPIRPPRFQPRKLKRAHSSFPVMPRPRAEYIINAPQSNRDTAN